MTPKETGFVQWFELNLILVKNRITFSTEISESINGLSIRGILSNVVKDVLDVAINVQRVDTGGVGDFLVEIKDHFDIRFLISNIYSNIYKLEQEAQAYKDTFKTFH